MLWGDTIISTCIQYLFHREVMNTQIPENVFLHQPQAYLWGTCELPPCKYGLEDSRTRARVSGRCPQHSCPPQSHKQQEMCVCNVGRCQYPKHQTQQAGDPLLCLLAQRWSRSPGLRSSVRQVHSHPDHIPVILDSVPWLILAWLCGSVWWQD